MSVFEETIHGTLDLNGQLQLARQSQLPPGPVQVIIRATPAPAAQRGLADVVREIAADQRARGFPGRSAEELRREEEDGLIEEAERDRQLDDARDGSQAGGP